jgi:hypothetical protein
LDKRVLIRRNTSPQDRSPAIDRNTQGSDPEKKDTKRRLPHEQAGRFLKSWLDWIEKEEGRTYGDPILEAIQRLERLVEI